MSSKTYTTDEVTGTDEPIRVFLWMLPRTRSTVLTKCMTFIDDCQIWMEPYCMCYMNNNFWNPEFGKNDPLVQKFQKRMDQLEEGLKGADMHERVRKASAELPNISEQSKFTHDWVKKQLELKEPGKKVIFVKDQTFAIDGKLESLPAVKFRHTFLIRHPREVFVSYKKMSIAFFYMNTISWEECHAVNDVPVLPVTQFYKSQLDLLHYVKENIEPDPIIIDSFDLVSKPKAVVSKYLELLGIPFQESYMKWDSDPSNLSKYWKGSDIVLFGAADNLALKRAYNSTQFDNPIFPRGEVSKDVKMTADIEKLIEDAMPYYEEMYASRLVVD